MTRDLFLPHNRVELLRPVESQIGWVLSAHLGWRAKLRAVQPSHFPTLLDSYYFDILGNACGRNNPRAPFVEFAWWQVIYGAKKDVSLPLGPRGDI